MTNLLADAQQSQLLVIDVQTRLANAMPEKPRAQLLKNINILAQAAQKLDIPLHFTEQYPKGLGPTESELQAFLAPAIPIEKTCFSCCQADNFLDAIQSKNRKQIVVSGMESHVCVLQTVIQLIEQGFQVFVINDAIVSRNKHHHKNALTRMQQAGAIMANHESILFEWLRDAAHPRFKSLSALIR